MLHYTLIVRPAVAFPYVARQRGERHYTIRSMLRLRKAGPGAVRYLPSEDPNAADSDHLMLCLVFLLSVHNVAEGEVAAGEHL